MKKILVCFLLFLCALLVVIKNVSAQPYGNGMFSLFMPLEKNYGNESLTLKGVVTDSWAGGYEFNDHDIVKRYQYIDGQWQRVDNNEDSLHVRNVVHIFTSNDTNWSIYSDEYMNVPEAISIFQLYDQKRADEIMKEFNFIDKNAETYSYWIEDTIKTGIISHGNKKNPRMEKFLILSGQIIMKYRPRGNLLTIEAWDVTVANSPFIFKLEEIIPQ